MLGKKGIALITVIIIILITGILLFNAISFISNNLALSISRTSSIQALYLAQAGLYYALAYHINGYSSPYWIKYRNRQVSGNFYYNVGVDANFLLVDADKPYIDDSDGTDNALRRVHLSNLNYSSPITVNSLKVEWYNFGGLLNRVRLGGSNRNLNPPVSSGSVINLANPFTLNARKAYDGDDDNGWRFTTTIPNNGIVVVTFYFSDGSSRKAYLLNNGRSGNNEFSITATGEVRDKIRWRRTIEATYDVGVNKITSWQEKDTHITS